MHFFEFHRRHQSLEELAVDVGEAQIRLYRRERLEVVSLVWDLYGSTDEPVIEERTFAHGATILKRPVAGRVPAGWNLRGLGYQGAAREGAAVLWALAAHRADPRRGVAGGGARGEERDRGARMDSDVAGEQISTTSRCYGSSPRLKTFPCGR